MRSVVLFVCGALVVGALFYAAHRLGTLFGSWLGGLL